MAAMATTVRAAAQLKATLLNEFKGIAHTEHIASVFLANDSTQQLKAKIDSALSTDVQITEHGLSYSFPRRDKQLGKIVHPADVPNEYTDWKSYPLYLTADKPPKPVLLVDDFVMPSVAQAETPYAEVALRLHLFPKEFNEHVYGKNVTHVVSTNASLNDALYMVTVPVILNENDHSNHHCHNPFRELYQACSFAPSSFESIKQVIPPCCAARDHDWLIDMTLRPYLCNACGLYPGFDQFDFPHTGGATLSPSQHASADKTHNESILHQYEHMWPGCVFQGHDAVRVSRTPKTRQTDSDDVDDDGKGTVRSDVTTKDSRIDGNNPINDAAELERGLRTIYPNSTLLFVGYLQFLCHRNDGSKKKADPHCIVKGNSVGTFHWHKHEFINVRIMPMVDLVCTNLPHLTHISYAAATAQKFHSENTYLSLMLSMIHEADEKWLATRWAGRVLENVVTDEETGKREKRNKKKKKKKKKKEKTTDKREDEEEDEDDEEDDEEDEEDDEEKKESLHKKEITDELNQPLYSWFTAPGHFYDKETIATMYIFYLFHAFLHAAAPVFLVKNVLLLDRNTVDGTANEIKTIIEALCQKEETPVVVAALEPVGTCAIRRQQLEVLTPLYMACNIRYGLVALDFVDQTRKMAAHLPINDNRWTMNMASVIQQVLHYFFHQFVKQQSGQESF